jgi:hypothetical protein
VSFHCLIDQVSSRKQAVLSSNCKSISSVPNPNHPDVGAVTMLMRTCRCIGSSAMASYALLRRKRMALAPSAIVELPFVRDMAVSGS